MSMRSALVSIAVVGTVSAGVIGQQNPPPPSTRRTSPAPLVVVGRSKVATKYGIVAASQPLAARAGVQVLERGGNAVDAAIATNAVLGLVEPEMNGIGGDLFAIISASTGSEPLGLNAGGWAPSGLTP